MEGAGGITEEPPCDGQLCNYWEGMDGAGGITEEPPWDGRLYNYWEEGGFNQFTIDQPLL